MARNTYADVGGGMGPGEAFTLLRDIFASPEDVKRRRMKEALSSYELATEFVNKYNLPKSEQKKLFEAVVTPEPTLGDAIRGRKAEPMWEAEREIKGVPGISRLTDKGELEKSVDVGGKYFPKKYVQRAPSEEEIGEWKEVLKTIPPEMLKKYNVDISPEQEAESHRRTVEAFKLPPERAEVLRDVRLGMPIRTITDPADNKAWEKFDKLTQETGDTDKAFNRLSPSEQNRVSKLMNVRSQISSREGNMGLRREELDRKKSQDAILNQSRKLRDAISADTHKTRRSLSTEKDETKLNKELSARYDRQLRYWNGIISLANKNAQIGGSPLPYPTLDVRELPDYAPKDEWIARERQFIKGGATAKFPTQKVAPRVPLSPKEQKTVDKFKLE